MWDHPQFKAILRLPKGFRPALELTPALAEFYSWPEDIQEARLTVLTVIGDAICANEGQLRRYMISKMTASQTSQHIEYLRKKGFVQRYKCIIDGYNDEDGEPIKINTPAPINLGPAGYLLLTYLNSARSYMDAEAWIKGNGSSMIQRFVAANEIRCKFVESKIARSWSWYPSFADDGFRRLKKPMAIMGVGEDTEFEDSRAWMIFERAQLNQNFIGYFKDRLNLYRYLFDKYGYLPVRNYPDDGEKIVVISCSTVKIAEALQEEIGLHKFPFTIWVLIDEWFDTAEDSTDITKAFASPVKTPTGYVLRRFKVNL
ncbi:hypothetical protein [Solibacillus sp. NPDC093137]|uniref:hypothetical protein n=1 Tax=Solibacillus sp. NPDC093137 TaxID=3390678 RepID=UPI003D028E5D